MHQKFTCIFLNPSSPFLDFLPLARKQDKCQCVEYHDRVTDSSYVFLCYGLWCQALICRKAWSKAQACWLMKMQQKHTISIQVYV